jgi:hypothetical protein
MFLKMGYGVYFFFASLMILSIFFVFFLVPETKSIPLEAMDRLFKVKPVWNANKTVMEYLKIQDEDFRHNVEGVVMDDDKPVVNELERKVSV